MQPQIISSGLYRITNLVNGKAYIGICKKSPERRFAAHITAARAGAKTALHCAIRKYGEENFEVKQLVIAEFGQYLKELEVKAIAAYGTRAPAGYNLTAGGDGVVDASPEVRAKISAGRLANPPVLSKEGREIISTTHRTLWSDPTHKAARSANIKAGLNDPVVHAARCEAIQKAASSDRGRAVKREQAKLLWSTQEYRDKVNAAAKIGMSTPEAKANRSRAAKEAWAKRKAA